VASSGYELSFLISVVPTVHGSQEMIGGIATSVAVIGVRVLAASPHDRAKRMKGRRLGRGAPAKEMESIALA
jgi:hypothetical protein